MPGTPEKNAEAYWNDLMVQVGLTPNSFFSAGELKHRNGVLDATQAELGRARGEVDITQAELKQTQGVLDQTIEELGRRKKECSDTQALLQQTRSALDAMRSECGSAR